MKKLKNYFIMLTFIATSFKIFSTENLKPIEQIANELKKDATKFENEIQKINQNLKTWTTKLQQQLNPVPVANEAILFIQENIPNQIIRKALSNIETSVKTLNIETMHKNKLSVNLSRHPILSSADLTDAQALYKPLIKEFNELLFTIIRRTQGKPKSDTLLTELMKKTPA